MKRFVGIAMVVAVAASLGACGQKKVACSDPDGLKTLEDLLKGEASKQLAAQKKPGGDQAFTQSSVRATLDSLRLGFDSVRTDKSDPDSDKVFCAADLRLSIPADRLANVENGFSLLQGSLGDVAQRLGFEREANTFKSKINYSLQPTDDRKSIFAETESSKSIVDFLASVAVGDLYKSGSAQGAVQARFDVPKVAPSTVQGPRAMPESPEYKEAYACAMESFKEGAIGPTAYCVGNSRDPSPVEERAYQDAERDFSGK